MRELTAIENELVKPLDKSRVRKRAGRGGSGELSYLETHEVKRTANEVFGHLGWSCETLECAHVATSEFERRDKRLVEVVYRARVRVTVCAKGVSAVSEGTGFGNGSCPADGPLMDAHELAGKEAESDALKRALARFGDRFGLALYDKTQARVAETPIALKIDLDRVYDEDTLRQVWASLKPEEKGPHLEAFRLARARLGAK